MHEATSIPLCTHLPSNNACKCAASDTGVGQSARILGRRGWESRKALQWLSRIKECALPGEMTTVSIGNGGAAWALPRWPR
jgi:hypothetical protein